MKALISIISCLLFSSILSAQTLDYFGNNPVWKINATFDPGQGSNYNYLSYVSGDSLINDTLYYKVYKEQYNVTPYLAHLIRQEGQKVFQRNSSINNGTEELIDDFSVEPGEFYIKTGALVTENDIDSVLINGLYHKVLFNRFIEGIGFQYPTFELITPISPPDLHIICYGTNYENITLEENNSLDSEWIDEHTTCDLTLSLSDNVNELLNSERIKLYPNPAAGKITIAQASPNKETQWQINNFSGKMILQGSFRSESKVLDVSDLTVGIYFISIIEESAKSTKKLIIK